MKKKGKTSTKRRVTGKRIGDVTRSKSQVVVTEFLSQMKKVSEIILILKAKIELLDIWKANMMDQLRNYLSSTSIIRGPKKIFKINPTKDKGKPAVVLRNQKLNHNLIQRTRGRPRKVTKIKVGNKQLKSLNSSPKFKHRDTDDLQVHLARRAVSSVSQTRVGYSNVTSQDAEKMIKRITVKTRNGLAKRFKCLICSQRLVLLQKAKLHVSRVHLNGGMTCPKCDSVVDDHKLLQRHKRLCQVIKVIAPKSKSRPTLKIYPKFPPKYLLTETPEMENRGKNQRYSLRNRKQSLDSSNDPNDQSKNVIVRNPFQNFDLKQALNATVFLERLRPSKPVTEESPPKLETEESPSKPETEESPPKPETEESPPLQEIELETNLNLNDQEFDFQYDPNEGQLIHEEPEMESEISTSTPNREASPPPDSNEDPVIPHGLSTISDVEISQIFGHVSPLKFKSLGFADIHSEFNSNSQGIVECHTDSVVTGQGSSSEHFGRKSSSFQSIPHPFKESALLQSESCGINLYEEIEGIVIAHE